MTDSFDVNRALAELKAGLKPQQNQVKLSFSERCGAFCALYQKVPHSIVARAFGITKTTASLIAGCLPKGLDHRVIGLGFEDKVITDTAYPPDAAGVQRTYTASVPVEVVTDYNPNKRRNPERKLRYQDVAREFIHLGRDEFIRRYYTDSIHERLVKAKYQAGHEDLGRGQNGANRAAAKFSFKYFGPVHCEGGFYRIGWIAAGKLEFEGWHYAPCQEDGSRFEGDDYDWKIFIKDQEARAFRTSAEAYDAIFALHGLESPRPKPGRPKNGIK